MSGPVLHYEDLRRLCRGTCKREPRLSTVEAWARQQGIRYKYDGHGGIWTTVAALNAALGVAANDGEAYSLDILPG